MISHNLLMKITMANAILASLGIDQRIENYELGQGKSLNENDTRLARNSGLNSPFLLGNDSRFGIQFGVN